VSNAISVFFSQVFFSVIVWPIPSTSLVLFHISRNPSVFGTDNIRRQFSYLLKCSANFEAAEHWAYKLDKVFYAMHSLPSNVMPAVKEKFGFGDMEKEAVEQKQLGNPSAQLNKCIQMTIGSLILFCHSFFHYSYLLQKGKQDEQWWAQEWWWCCYKLVCFIKPFCIWSQTDCFQQQKITHGYTSPKEVKEVFEQCYQGYTRSIGFGQQNIELSHPDLEHNGTMEETACQSPQEAQERRAEQ